MLLGMSTEAVRIDQLERIFKPSVFEDKIGTHLDIYHEMQQSGNQFVREPRIRAERGEFTSMCHLMLG
jgi:hypothetical protein